SLSLRRFRRVDAAPVLSKLYARSQQDRVWGHRTFEAERDVEPGAGGDDYDRQSPGPTVSADQRRPKRFAAAISGRGRRRLWSFVARLTGRCRFRAADWLRQRGELAVGSRRGETEGVRVACGVGRQPSSADSATAYRNGAACAYWRNTRPPRRRLEHALAGCQLSIATTVGCFSKAGSHGVGFHACDIVIDGTHFWAGAGAQVFANRWSRSTQARRQLLSVTEPCE